MQIIANMHGAMEGKELDKMKMHMSGDIQIVNEEDVMTGNAKIVIHNGIFYIRLDDTGFYYQDEYVAEISSFEQTVAPLLGQWYSMPVDELLEEISGNDGGTIDSLAPLFESAQVEVDNPRDVVTGLFDSIFDMDSSNFFGGKSYTLTLKPDFLYNAVSYFEQVTNRSTDDPIDSYDDAYGEVEVLQELLDDNTVAKLKIDTNNNDELRFGRYYVSLKMPDNGIQFAINGEMQHRTKPVYLDVPTITASLEESLLEMQEPSSILDEDEDEYEDEDEHMMDIEDEELDEEEEEVLFDEFEEAEEELDEEEEEEEDEEDEEEDEDEEEEDEEEDEDEEDEEEEDEDEEDEEDEEEDEDEEDEEDEDEDEEDEIDEEDEDYIDDEEWDEEEEEEEEWDEEEEDDSNVVEREPVVSTNCRNANPVVKTRMQRSGQCRVHRVSRRILKGE